MYMMDLTNVPKADGKAFSPIPAGKYLAMLTETKVGRMKNGTGCRVDATVEIIDGEHRGRKVFEGLNILNPNSVTNQAISQGIVRALAEATGVALNAVPQDLGPCKMKPVIVQVRIEKGKDQYPDRNRIVTFEPASNLPNQQAWANPAAQQQQLPGWANQQQPQSYQSQPQPQPQYHPQAQPNGYGTTQPNGQPAHYAQHAPAPLSTAQNGHPPTLQVPQPQPGWTPPQQPQTAPVAPTPPAAQATHADGRPKMPWES